jgi:hypothetical protein
MRFEVDPTRVVHETIDGEAILIHMKTGCYYSLEGAGAQIWGALVDGRTPEEVVRLLCTSYDGPRETIESAVSVLVDELRSEGLIDDSPETAPNGQRVDDGRSCDAEAGVERFEAPVLHRYADMADFMLVDPIHEVDQRGWPNRTVTP